MEATEAEVYRRLAKAQKDSANREILERIAREEERHEAVIGERTGKEVRANRWMVFWQILLARFFGLTFTVKMMENSEKKMASEYREVGLDEIAEEEEAHEAELVGMLEEEGLRHLGSLILGLSDALVELTGALVGQGGSLHRNWLHRHCFPARNAIPNSHRRRPVAARARTTPASPRLHSRDRSRNRRRFQRLCGGGARPVIW